MSLRTGGGGDVERNEETSQGDAGKGAVPTCCTRGQTRIERTTSAGVTKCDPN